MLGYLGSFLILLFVGAVLTSSMVTRLPGVSPIDEWSYIDSLDRASRLELARPGQTIGSYARDVISCRGVIGVGRVGNDCGAPQPDELYPLGAISPAPIHPPTYFFVSAAFAKLIIAADVSKDLYNAGRLAGAFWLVAGGLALVVVGSFWGVRWWVSATAASSMAFLPVAAVSIGFLSPDAPFLLSAALPLLGISLWLKKSMPSWWLVLWGALPVFLKTTHVLASLGAALVLLVAASADADNRRTLITGAALIGGGAGLALIIWKLALAAIAIGEIPPHPASGRGVSPMGMIGYSYWGTLATSGAPIPLPPAAEFVGRAYMAIVGAGALGSLVFGRGLPRRLGITSTVLALFAQLMLSTMVLLSGGAFIRAIPRYSLAVIPLMIAPVVLARRPAVVAIIFGSVSAMGVIGFATWGFDV